MDAGQLQVPGGEAGPGQRDPGTGEDRVGLQHELVDLIGQLSGQVGAWLGAMQLLGVLGTLVTLLVAMPAASRLSRAEPTGATAATFDALQRRVVMAGGVSTGLALLALLAGALYRA